MIIILIKIKAKSFKYVNRELMVFFNGIFLNELRGLIKLDWWSNFRLVAITLKPDDLNDNPHIRLEAAQHDK